MSAPFATDNTHLALRIPKLGSIVEATAASRAAAAGEADAAAISWQPSTASTKHLALTHEPRPALERRTIHQWSGGLAPGGS